MTVFGLDAAWWGVVLAGVEIMVVVVSVLFVVAQLRTSNRSSDRDELLKVYQLYVDSTSLPQDYVRCAEFHWRDHFDEGPYRADYEGDDDLHRNRRFSYLLMKRKFTYLVFQRWLKNELAHGADTWLTELVDYREFRHLHRRHAAYYPAFAKKVEGMLKGPDDETPWMAERLDASPDTEPAAAI